MWVVGGQAGWQDLWLDMLMSMFWCSILPLRAMSGSMVLMQLGAMMMSMAHVTV